MTTSPVTFRPFTPTDAPACLVLFNSNCPPYFHPSERADFEQFLQDLEDRGDYWVMELSGGLVGCGGVWFGGGGQAGLGWGMVRRDLHGQGRGWARGSPLSVCNGCGRGQKCGRSGSTPASTRKPSMPVTDLWSCSAPQTALPLVWTR